MKISQHLTYRADYVSHDLQVVANALSDEVRELKNNCIFFIRQLLTAKDRISCGLGIYLHANQIDAIRKHDAAVAAINAVRTAKGKGKILDTFELAHKSQFEDKNILDRVLRDWVAPATKNKPAGQKHAPYRALPAKSAQLVLQEVGESFKAFREATVVYRKNPADFTGEPEMPDYYRDDQKPGFPLNNQQVTTKGRLTALNPLLALSQQQIDSWVAYPAQAEIERALEEAREDGAEWRELRITPTQNGMRLHVVCAVDFEVADDSAVARMEPFRNQRTGKLDPDFKFRLTEVRAAGLDPGLNSLVTLCFGTGHKPVVMDARREMDKIEAIDLEIDALKAALTPPHLKGSNLPKKHIGYLLALAWSASPELDRLYARRRRVVRNFTHQCSNWLAKILADRKIDVLVFGRNKRLKEQTAKDKSCKENRDFHRFPHFELLAQLVYKLRMKGIAVVETEESYTSKASFVLAEPMEKEEDGGPRHFTGTRNGRVFTTPTGPCKWRRLHADVNAAYNIMRKYFPGFRWHKGLSRWFEVFWFSPKGGFRKCRVA